MTVDLFAVITSAGDRVPAQMGRSVRADPSARSRCACAGWSPV
jgi:hypothetical protein